MSAELKGKPLLNRAGFAFSGVRTAVKTEKSFRIQLFGLFCLLLVLLLVRPGFYWTALCLLVATLVLSLELINTALEFVLDGIHPSFAVFVRDAKDCAAGAVLLMSVCALILFVMMLLDVYFL